VASPAPPRREADMANTKSTPAAAPTAPSNGGSAKPPAKLTKMDAVKQAQAKLGKDAKPLAIQKYVKDELGIDISTAVVSAYKKEIAKKAKKGQAGAKPKGRAKAAPVASAAARETAPKPPAATKPAAESGGVPLKDILAVKELVERLGAGPLHTLIDAFAR
jgi:hypothetical protein